MELNQAKKDLLKLQERIAAFNHAIDLIHYDGETVAPKGTALNRAQSLAILGEELYKITTGEETVSLLEFLDANKEALDEKEKRMVFILSKDIRKMQRIPLEEYVAYQRLVAESESVWVKAKHENDFESFRPYLEKIFDTVKRFAKYCAPEKDPYDYWLDEYEEGINMEICDAFFETLRGKLLPLLRRIKEKPQVDYSFLKGDFCECKQEELAYYLMRVLGLDLEQVGLSTTEHPFTATMGSHHDERITTHYHRDDFISSLYSVVHEGGHALYDTGSDDDLAYTVLDCGVSMGIHESQSRFYENIIGRSKPFIDYIFPKVLELFPEALSGCTSDDFYRAVNKVEPSLVRIESDEATYCFHIMVRYELEKAIMHDELEVKDLPEAWNKMYKEYLGVDVPDDTHGVLQDSHWSFGAIGYFPSYALGNAYGAQFAENMRKDVDIDAALAKGDMTPINDWNREHIWKFGGIYTPKEIIQKAAGSEFSTDAYIRYLEAKYGEIYGL